MPPRLLITRPADEAARTVEAARAAGFWPVEAPLLAIEPINAARPAHQPDAILFTSPRAPESLAALAPELKACPAYSVGPRTSQALIAAGFHLAGEGSGDGNAALQLVAAKGHLHVLHPCGQDHIALAVPPGVSLAELPVYRARAAQALPAEAHRQLAAGEIFATLLLSPRTARVFSRLVERAGLQPSALRLVALSANVAQAAGPGWGAMEIAPAPRLDECLAAAMRLWQGTRHA